MLSERRLRSHRARCESREFYLVIDAAQILDVAVRQITGRDRRSCRAVGSGSPSKVLAMNLSAVSSGRWRYPRASPSPPIWSSPTTPIGTGIICRSSMYSLVLPIGLPMGIERMFVIELARYRITARKRGALGWTVAVDNFVWGSRSSPRRTWGTDKDSPPIKSWRTSDRACGASSITVLNSDAVSHSVVTPVGL